MTSPAGRTEYRVASYRGKPALFVNGEPVPLSLYCYPLSLDLERASVFTAAVPLPESLLRGMARYAGAHVYHETDDLLYVDERGS